MQEDVLREHKLLLDGLRRDLDALEIPESSTAAVASLTGNKHANLYLILKCRVKRFTKDIFDLPKYFVLLATLAAVEQKTANTIFSFDEICNAIETASGTGASRIDCCVNGTNGKMVCILHSTLTNAGNVGYVAGSNRGLYGIDEAQAGECDRGATGTPAESTLCSDGGYVPAG